MGFISDVFKFEKNKLKNAFGKYKDDPERLLLGINTPFESKVWGKVTGKEYTPTVDMFGGATKDDVSTAQSRGINTGPGEKMHDVARIIASIYAGGAAADAAGAGTASGTSSGTGTGAAEGIGAVNSFDTGAMASATGGGGKAAASTPAWMKYAKMGSNISSLGGGGGGGYQPEPVQQDMSFIDRMASGEGKSMLDKYNSNTGIYNDGYKIDVNNGIASLKDSDGRTVGNAPADDRLYSALVEFENQRKRA